MLAEKRSKIQVESLYHWLHGCCGDHREEVKVRDSVTAAIYGQLGVLEQVGKVFAFIQISGLQDLATGGFNESE